MTKEYKLKITNLEAKIILENKIYEWFDELKNNDDNNFLHFLLANDLEVINLLMSEIVESNFSFFDIKSSIKNERKEAESFYHGFILGLIINLKDRYIITSNRESGFGRYDICLYPKNKNDHGIIIEFKSINKEKEKNLKDACTNALKQIKENDYIKDLLVRNIPINNIYIYGFAFQKKKVLICGGSVEEVDWKSIYTS